MCISSYWVWFVRCGGFCNCSYRYTGWKVVLAVILCSFSPTAWLKASYLIYSDVMAIGNTSPRYKFARIVVSQNRNVEGVKK